MKPLCNWTIGVDTIRILFRENVNTDPDECWIIVKSGQAMCERAIEQQKELPSEYL